MNINKERWLEKTERVKRSLDAAINNLILHQHGAHSARVMKHRLQGRRYVVDMLESLIEGRCVHPKTKAHVFKQFLVEYPSVGPQIRDGIHFELGDNVFRVLREHGDLTLDGLTSYLRQFDCIIDDNGVIREQRSY